MTSYKTLIIAEAGVNHNGDLDLAKELVSMAADAGADFVKFQTFSAYRLATAYAEKADYQNKNTSSRETQKDMLRRLELSRDDHEKLIYHCQKNNIGFLSTGFDIECVNFLMELGVDLVKIPSGEITNLPYLRHAGSLRKAVLLSTGMATLGEVDAAVRIISESGLDRSEIVLLHCNTEYPTPMTDVNLQAMASMRAAFGLRVGYSDHTQGIEVAIAAAALGAAVIEKHFTLDRAFPGPDHLASLEPSELKLMVRAIRNIETAMGNGFKQPTPSEAKNRSVVRKSIVALRPIREGEIFSVLNIGTKRPGTGISPMRWDEVIGKMAPRDFVIDEQIIL